MANHTDEHGKSTPAQSKVARKMRVVGRSAPPSRHESGFMHAQLKARKQKKISQPRLRRMMRIESASRKPVGKSVV